MQAVAKHWSPAERSRAGGAGRLRPLCFCRSHDAQVEGIEGLVRAAESGELPFKELEAAEARVQALKHRYLAGYGDPDPKQARLAADQAEHRALAEEIALRSGLAV